MGREPELALLAPRLLRARGGARRHAGPGVQSESDAGRLNFIGPLVISVEQQPPIVILAEVHAGCSELFGSERICAIRDPKDKTVAIPGRGEPQHVFLASMLSYAGVDPDQGSRTSPG